MLSTFHSFRHWDCFGRQYMRQTLRVFFVINDKHYTFKAKLFKYKGNPHHPFVDYQKVKRVHYILAAE